MAPEANARSTSSCVGIDEDADGAQRSAAARLAMAAAPLDGDVALRPGPEVEADRVGAGVDAGERVVERA